MQDQASPRALAVVMSSVVTAGSPTASTCMPSDGLIHRIIQNFGCEMMQGTFVGASNIHAGAVPDGLQALQYLNITGVITIT